MLKRVHIHWTAGGPQASSLDRQHYHVLIEQDGTVVLGDKKPEANRNTSDGHYAAHTRAANTGAIGVGLCGMRGARDRPFSAGNSPLTWPQIEAMASVVADLCETYDIDVTRETVLTHAEVQPTLGIRQRGKWDVRWLPDMDRAGDAIEVGDRLREMVLLEMQDDDLWPLTPTMENWESWAADD